MKLKDYLKDKIIEFIIVILTFFFVALFLMTYVKNNHLVILILFILVLGIILMYSVDYFKRKKFYDNVKSRNNELEQKYLLSEVVDRPAFYEGAYLYDLMESMNRYMVEEIKGLERSQKELNEYMELWLHEVKTPLAKIKLIIHNNPYQESRRISEQIDHVDNYLEQVLYYARLNTAETDYLIKEYQLSDIVNQVIKQNRDIFLNRNIKLAVGNLDAMVYTDKKWLVFILNQILNNSLKYIDHDLGLVKIYLKEGDDWLDLYLEDNGIGISNHDLPLIFNHGFTGENGRIIKSSTGMGLFIAKKLLDKLHHSITIDSEEGKYTKVCIRFNKHHFYDVLD